MYRHALVPTFVAAFLFIITGCSDQLTGPSSNSSGPPASVTSSNNSSTSISSCDEVVGPSESIQSAVDAAASGDKICIDGGTHREQVVINKDLVLTGVNDPTIEAPNDPKDFTIPESAGSTWEPIVFAFGGTESGGDVSGSGIVDVSITGLTIDGRGDADSGPRYPGILFRNVKSSKGITGNVVEDMGVGGRETFGILAYGNSKVTIDNNRVDGYERGGIGANGDGGAHPSPEVKITNNTLTGSGDGSKTAWAPNGIQIGFGATGRVTNNTVQKSRWAAKEDDAWSASCILVFESDGVQISGNQVSNCDVGVGVGSWAWFRATANNTKIDKNQVDGALIGLELETIAWNGFSSANPSVSNTKLINNELSGTIEGNPGDFGIHFEIVDADPNFDPVVDNNKVISNFITGFEVEIEDADATDTKQAANKPFSP